MISRRPIIILSLIIIAFTVLPLIWFTSKTSIKVGSLENIKGIPFAAHNNSVLITEELAHTDIYLNKSIFAKQAKIKITFTPLKTSSISVGIRENPFWLSYTQYPLYNSSANNSQNDKIRAEATIPLTDKLTDKDGFLDMMIFSNSPNLSIAGQPHPDFTYWLLHDLEINVEPVVPSRLEAKDFILSIFKNEKPI